MEQSSALSACASEAAADFLRRRGGVGPPLCCTRWSRYLQYGSACVGVSGCSHQSCPLTAGREPEPCPDELQSSFSTEFALLTPFPLCRPQPGIYFIVKTPGCMLLFSKCKTRQKSLSCSTAAFSAVSGTLPCSKTADSAFPVKGMRALEWGSGGMPFHVPGLFSPGASWVQEADPRGCIFS